MATSFLSFFLQGIGVTVHDPQAFLSLSLSLFLLLACLHGVWGMGADPHSLFLSLSLSLSLSTGLEEGSSVLAAAAPPCARATPLIVGEVSSAPPHENFPLPWGLDCKE